MLYCNNIMTRFAGNIVIVPLLRRNDNVYTHVTCGDDKLHRKYRRARPCVLRARQVGFFCRRGRLRCGVIGGAELTEKSSPVPVCRYWCTQYHTYIIYPWPCCTTSFRKIYIAYDCERGRCVKTCISVTY